MLKHLPPNGGPAGRPPRSLPRPAAPQPLNVSLLSTPGPPGANSTANNKLMNGGPPRLLAHPHFPTPLPSVSSHSQLLYKERVGAREALTSLGLLCLVSLLLALLSLIFLLKISPGGREPPPPPPVSALPEDYAIVYDVTLALCALSLSLNLCCLLVCAIQFLFAVKLVRAPVTTGRGNKYLQKSSVSRVCAVGGFFISIPIFLTGIILYTFTQFHSTPAIVTSILIGIGILFCGGAMVHNVFVWQKEKTISVRGAAAAHHQPLHISAISPPTTFLGGVHNASVSFAHHNHSLPLHRTTPLAHAAGTQLTPLSGNHSHLSFGGGGGGHVYAPFGLRAATATPPTPKVGPAPASLLNPGRDASRSVSPGMPPAAVDLSSVAATNSPHELSTLV